MKTNNIEKKIDWLIPIIKAILRNQMKLAKAIQFKEQIDIEYLDEFDDLTKKEAEEK